MTWDQLYPQSRSFMGGSGGMIPGESWRTDLRGTPLSTGTQAIDAMGRRDTTARELWERGLLDKANADNEFLKTFANPGMRQNVFEAPTSPAEARRNAIIASQQLQERLTLENAGKGAVKDFGFNLAQRDRALKRAQAIQDMALDRARLGQQARRDQFGNIIQGKRLDLDARKAAELARYRDRSLTSREGLSRERLKATQNRAAQTDYDKDIQAAIRAITEMGMDPDEAADVWDLDDTDRERLYAYGDLVDEELGAQDLESEQIAGYLNARAMPLRKQLQEEGRTGPVVNGRTLPLPYLSPSDAATMKTGDVGPLMEEMIKLKGLGRVQQGPRGFEPVRRGPAPVPAQGQRQPITGAPGRGLTFAQNGLPIVLTPEHLAQVPRGRRFMDGRGKVRIKP